MYNIALWSTTLTTQDLMNITRSTTRRLIAWVLLWRAGFGTWRDRAKNAERSGHPNASMIRGPLKPQE
jgi:hypothetical protein